MTDDCAKTLYELSRVLSHSSKLANLQQKYQNAFKTLMVKSQGLKQLPKDKVTDTIKKWNIESLRTTLDTISVFVKENNQNVVDISKKASNIINSLNNTQTRNSNAHSDAYMRIKNNRKINNSNSLEMEEEQFEDYASLRDRINKSKLKNKTQCKPNKETDEEWSNRIFEDDENDTNNNTNTNQKQTFINPIHSVESLDAISIKNVEKRLKKKPQKKQEKDKKYRSYKNTTEAFRNAKWTVLIEAGKKCAQIAVCGAGQSVGFKNGFTHRQILKHTNHLLQTNYDKKSTLDVNNCPFLKNDKKNNENKKLIRITDSEILSNIKIIMPTDVKSYFENKLNQENLLELTDEENQDSVESHGENNDSQYENKLENQTQIENKNNKELHENLKELRELLSNDMYCRLMDILKEMISDIIFNYLDSNSDESMVKICEQLENISFENDKIILINENRNEKTDGDNEMKNELEIVKQKYKEINNKCAHLQKDNDALQKENNELRDENDDMFYKNKYLNKECDYLNKECDYLRGKLDKKRREIKRLKNVNKNRARSRSRSRSRNKGKNDQY